MLRCPLSAADHSSLHGSAAWILALVLLSVGCASVESTPPQESAAAEAKPGPEAVAETPPAPAAPKKKRIARAPESAATQGAPPADRTPPAATKPVEPAASEPVTRPAPDAPVAKPPAKVAAVPAPREPAAKKPAAAPAPEKPAGPPPLDLDSLEKRLKETSAIGVFTKLTLKNQVDELLDRFKAFYAGRTKTTLAELRQPYDLLILKVLTLLQDGDPPLANAIRSSREAIWGILSDPAKFSKLVS